MTFASLILKIFISIAKIKCSQSKVNLVVSPLNSGHFLLHFLCTQAFKKFYHDTHTIHYSIGQLLAIENTQKKIIILPFLVQCPMLSLCQLVCDLKKWCKNFKLLAIFIDFALGGQGFIGLESLRCLSSGIGTFR